MFKFDAAAAEIAWNLMTSTERAQWVRALQVNIDQIPDSEVEKVEAFFQGKIVHTVH